jgi:hypothetical protein
LQERLQQEERIVLREKLQEQIMAPAIEAKAEEVKE